MAPVWLGVLGIGGLGVALATRLPLRTPTSRIAALAVVGVAAAAVVPLADPLACAAPSPPCRRWSTGCGISACPRAAPVEQTPVWAAMTIGLPSRASSWSAAAVRATSRRRRARWAIRSRSSPRRPRSLRSSAVRAGPPTRSPCPAPRRCCTPFGSGARRVPHPLLRTLATAGALLAAMPGIVATMAFVATTLARRSRVADQKRASPAVRPVRGRRLAPLGRALVFAPIDITAELIATTHLRAVAGGYHRNAAAMERVIEGFTAPPERARAVIAATGATYVVACPGLNEVTLYREIAPHGLWARLERGERIACAPSASRPRARVARDSLAGTAASPRGPSPMREAPIRQAASWWQTRWFVVVATLLACVPLLLPDIAPIVDLPGHMGRYRVQLDRGAHPWLGEWYRVHWSLIGNLGIDSLIELLAPLIGLEARGEADRAHHPRAHRRRAAADRAREVHGRVPPTALFALPLAYGYPFQFGFVNFALSMVLRRACSPCGCGWRGPGICRAPSCSRRRSPWVCHTFGWACSASSPSRRR
ncbi:hypothetical protein AB5I41_20395 [Sphingomonas sp. MMS24-JH45]